MDRNLRLINTEDRTREEKQETYWKAFFVCPVTFFAGLLCLGNLYAFSIFHDSVIKLGWSEKIIPYVVMIQGPTACMMGFIVGADTQKRGLWFYGLLGLMLMSAGFSLGALAVKIKQVWLFLISLGLLEGIGYGMIYLVLLQHAVNWLAPKRGLANSILGVSIGMSAFLCTLVNHYLLQHYSMEVTLLLMAAYTMIPSPFFALLFLEGTQEKE